MKSRMAGLESLIAGLFAVFCLLSVPACQLDTTAAPVVPATRISSTKHLKLAFVTNNSSDFWTVAHAGIEQAKTDDPNLDVKFVVLADPNPTAQQEVLTGLVAEGYDGIAVSPVDPQAETAFLKELAAKTLLVTQDADAPESTRAFYVGVDNLAAGKQAGELLKKALPGGGKITLFVGSVRGQSAKDRVAGIREAIKGTKIEYADTLTDDVDRAKAKMNAADTLVRQPDIAAMVGLWSYNGPAILSAIKDAGLTGKVKIVSFDEADDVLAGVKAGDIEGTVVQQPFELGRQSIELMARDLRGDKSFIPESHRIQVPMLVLDKKNVDAYQANLKKWLGK